MKAVPAEFLDSTRSGPCEVWLRGNARPLVALALVAACLTILAALSARTVPAGGMRWAAVAAVVVAALVSAFAGAMACAAGRPRIERRGDCLRLRLAPGIAYDVPLEVVECFFHGAHPVGKTVEPCTGEAAHHEEHGEESGRRRQTLVVRIAERASEWQRRPTFSPWAGWNRGSVVIDGLWCEPLSMDRFGELARKLVEAKRDASAAARNRG